MSLERTAVPRVALAESIPAHAVAIAVLAPAPLGTVPLVASIPRVFKGEAGQCVTVFQGEGVPVVLAGVGELDGELRPCSESALRTQRGLGNARPVSDPRGPIAVAAAKAVADAVSAVPEADRAEGCVAVDLSLVMGVLAGADAAADAATLSALLGAVVRKLVLSMHKWDTNITAGGCNAGKRGKRVGEIVLVGTDAGPWTDAAREAAERAYTVAEGIAFARDLNETRAGPGGVLFYAEVAKEVAAASGGALKVEVVDHAALVAMGAGCITAVGQGHPDGAALVLIDYTPVVDAPAICLVGKGVVFDTGGLQIKPDPGIRTMYLDMCGAGGVLSAMRVLAKLKPQVNVTGVMCLAENAIGPLAVHPLDIVKSLRGLTVEVTHTDAEGRLCLVDGICFAERNRKVSTLIDIATLTGAQVVALGAHRSALFSYNDALADELTEASRGTCDNIWRMPVGPEHVEAMKSDVADLSNLGKLGRSAGSSPAAAFIGEFVDCPRWAHLDIAGPAAEEDGKTGATGASVDLLVNFVARSA